MNNKILFQEKQKFTQWWLWVLLILITLIPLYGIWKQLIQGETFGTKSMSNIGLIFFAGIIFILIIFFWFVELRTQIDKSGINMQYVPFLKKNFAWRDVKSAEILNYGFVGGWGIRFGTNYGTVYNTKGKMGLAIELVNGKKFLIGSQRPEELQKVLKEILD